VTTSVSVWLVLVLALVAANLPFVSQKVFGLISRQSPKSLGLRLLELLALYLLSGLVGLFLENRAGQIVPQTWEFYAITVTLFLTFAFPGFVYRYLLRHRD
jgi:ABC-type microcin C transport system permease subunit YejB